MGVMRTTKQLEEKIHELHLRENKLNFDNSECDKQIGKLLKKKKKLNEQASKVVKYRNIIINQLYLLKGLQNNS